MTRTVSFTDWLGYGLAVIDGRIPEMAQSEFDNTTEDDAPDSRIEERLGYGLLVPENRHPGTRHMSKLFAYAHLPPHLQDISIQFAMTAQFMVDHTQDGPELTETLRKLWEAKNCAVIHAGFLGKLNRP